MNTIKIFLLRFKWYIVLISIVVIGFVTKAIGSSSKQAKYEKIIKDVVEKKRDELFEREKQISDSVIKTEEDLIETKEEEIIEIKKELDARSKSGRKFDSSETNKRLKEMGLK